MKYSIIALIALVASGCSVDNSGESCDTIHSYTEQQTDATGIILKPSDEMYVSFETVSKLYQETQACMGMTAPAPIVSYEDFRQRIGSLGGWGVYVVSGAEVWINTAIDEYIPRNCHSDADTLRHEYVHHILHMNDMGHLSGGHAAPEFEKCGMGTYVKDGVPAAK
jgi:hypothetical protein